MLEKVVKKIDSFLMLSESLQFIIFFTQSFDLWFWLAFCRKAKNKFKHSKFFQLIFKKKHVQNKY